jgi:hypothetical protein
MKRHYLFLVSAAAWLATPAATAHELWLHSKPGDRGATIRLTFGDTPALSAAESVAEIASVALWSGAQPLEPTRLRDSIEAHAPAIGSGVINAFADRGVVKHKSQSSIIYLAGYGQARAIEGDRPPLLGLREDQPRLLLYSQSSGPPVIRASRNGKPLPDTPVKIFQRDGDPTEIRTDGRGELPAPDLREGPWHLLLSVVDKTPGTREGHEFSETRYVVTLEISAEAAFGPAVAACLERVKEVHGATGPWAVAGYRIGERALKELGLARHDHSLEVVHYCPLQVQFSCMADGLSAATGASSGKLNLRIQESPVSGLKTTIKHRESGRSITFTLKPEFVRSVSEIPVDRLEAEGRKVAALPDEAIFTFTDAK